MKELNGKKVAYLVECFCGFRGVATSNALELYPSPKDEVYYKGICPKCGEEVITDTVYNFRNK